MNVIATLTDRSVVVHLGDDGLWHPATDAPLEGLLADTLNIRSPRRSYMGCDGEHSHAYQEYAEEQAKAIIASLKKGGKFEDIAKKQSKDPGSGANGGDLDWAAPGNYVKEFSDAMVALSKGQVSAPVQSQFGFHIIRLDDVREAQLPKLEDVKPQIVQQMTQQRMAAFQQELRAKAKVE